MADVRVLTRTQGEIAHPIPLWDIRTAKADQFLGDTPPVTGDSAPKVPLSLPEPSTWDTFTQLSLSPDLSHVGWHS